jgi:DNA-binding NarL/FixJ family response regulator
MSSGRPERKQQIHQILTLREREIMELLGEGLSNKEIGGSLKLSPFTIKNHLARIFGKLQVRSRTAAVMAYFRSGRRG